MRLLRRWVGQCLLVLICCLTAPAIAAPSQVAVPLSDSDTPVLLRGEPQILLPRGSVSIADLASGRLDERLAPGSRPLVAFTGDNELWVRLRLRNPLPRAMRWHLDYALPSIDEVTVFERHGSAWSELSAGDKIPRSQWTRSGRYPRFHIDFAAGEEKLLFVRVRNAFAAPVPLQALREATGDLAEQATNVGFGMILGALVLLVGASLVQALLYRDASYYLYAAYTALMGLSFAALAGLAGEHLWGNYPRWNDAAKGVFPLAGAGVSVWLVRSMCRVSAREPRLSRVAALLGWVVIGAAIATAALGFIVLWLVGSAMLLAACTVLFIAAFTWRRGDSMGGWVFTAHLPLILVTALIVVRMFGLAPFDFDANMLLSLAIAAILPLLLMGLYLQSKQLLAVQVRARELSSTDALTGLLTPHLFSDRVRAAVGRYRKSGHNAIILYVRLVNADRIRELHGGAAVEHSMIRSAIKLQQQMPDADCIGRVDENTMGLILESVTSRTVIMERGARLVAHGLMPLAGLKPSVTLQFHVAAAVLADTPLDAPDLRAALEGTLSAMSPRTRRPIRFVEGGALPLRPAPEDDTPLGTLAA